MAKRKQKTITPTKTLHPRANIVLRLGAYIIDLLSIALLLMLATVFAVLIVMVFDKLFMSIFENTTLFVIRQIYHSCCIYTCRLN